MESQPEDTSQPSVRESKTVTESNTEIEMSKDIPDRVEIEETSEDNSKRKRTFEAWNHFKRVKVEGIQFAECNYCKTRLKAPAGYGTTHLHKHYEKVCKKRPRKIDSRQSFLKKTQKVSGEQELGTHIFNQEEARRELASMVILHDYPLSVVDHIGFRRYSTCLQPCFNMISRNTLKGDILKIYKDERTKYYNLLGKIKCRIAITTDMWTSSNNKGFMAVTGHFIDDNWTLQNCILRFLYVPAPHTAEVLADTLFEAVMDWNIDRKVSTITVDNCTINDAMINHLLQKLPTRDMPLDGKVLHMRCCAHILNLIVKDGLDIIGSSIERIRDSVIYWTASPSRVEKFEKTARQVPVNCTKKLCLDCKTRWNSTYLMLETAIIYKDVVPRLNIREKNYKSLPTEEDWVNAIEICGKLKLFHQVTEMFSGTLYPTSNFYFQKICDIKVKLDEWVKSPNTVIQDMALSMLSKYDKYWEVCHILMGVAVVLDPRYKMSLVEFFFFRKIYHESARFKIDEVRQNCYDLLFDYQSRCCTLNKSSSSIGSLENTMSSDVHSNLNVDDSLDEFEQFVVSKTSGATNLSATSELDMYLEIS
ncbi:UNVERIFIED_CONTAM: Zinc finger BED domain-containing protein RICESLEEPER 2 [Sesamum radiatum]|uniref:Zinc finger BED domain-containing protein RICESLEEPER 2 n=1 Tax=Sesamum radiatum TaxID=300843 RepID=A0AAW2KQS5_SESRA